MGDAAAQDNRMQRPIRRQVADILAAPAQEPQILDTLERPANEGVAFAGLLHLAGVLQKVDRARLACILYGHLYCHTGLAVTM
jgi:hypothetical protein